MALGSNATTTAEVRLDEGKENEFQAARAGNATILLHTGPVAGELCCHRRRKTGRWCSPGPESGECQLNNKGRLAVRYLPFGLQRPYIPLCLAVLTATLPGCRSWIRPGTDVPQSLNENYKPFDRGSAVLLPGADYHLATVRKGGPNQDEDILCSEPSPDWAIAFGTALAGAASGGASGGPSGSVSGSASTTEAITAAAGRTAGVVALRDGLYSACQAYANQLIGKDAYSLILSVSVAPTPPCERQ
jgi:hypothetical protein